MLKRNDLYALVDDDELLEVARKAIENALIEWRDGRMSMFNRGNGLVIREADGTDSSIIRMGPEAAVKIGVKAIADHIAEEREHATDDTAGRGEE